MDRLIPRNKREMIRLLKNTLLVILGTALLAFGTGIFLIPYDLVTGGVSGIGIVLEKVLSGVPLFASFRADTYASILIWVLFLLGVFALGKMFAMQTLVSTIVYPFVLTFAVDLVETNAFGGFFNLLSDKYAAFGESAIILAAVFGGAIVGAGSALTFLGGGSTGGTDIIALAVAKYIRGLKSSFMIFVVDAAVVVLGMFIIDNLVLTLLGIVSAFVCAIAVDKLFLGESSAFIAQIVSDKCDEINEGVINKMYRTSTITKCTGGYTGADREMLMVTFGVKQYAEFMALISSIDKNAFVTLHRAHEINGEGWTYGFDERLKEK